MNKVIAIVVTFNRKDLLLKVLHSLIDQSVKLEKIVVIDNSSIDGTECAVKFLSKEHTNIVYHNTGANLGGAGGFHYGFNIVKELEYSHLWLMDDDLLPEQKCLESMLALNHTGIVQPIRFNLDGSCAEVLPVKFDLSSLFVITPKRISVKEIFESGENISKLEIHSVAFEGPLISKEVVNSIGNPNPDFFIFCDDLDYSLRARQAGYKIICDTSAKAVRLLESKQEDDLLSWKGYFMLRNMFYIHRVYGENIFVRCKPFILAVGYSLVSILKGRLKQVKVVVSALMDSKALANTDSNKPISR